MRILLRNFDGEKYVWKDATFKNGEYFVEHDDKTFGKMEFTVEETLIAAVDGVENNQVVCNHCGEVIDNTPEAIEAHYKNMENKRDCYQCDNLVFSDRPKVLNREVEKIGDGYRVTQTMDTNLFCKVGWSKYDLDGINAKNSCKYLQCRKRGVDTFKDVFHRYPGVFDTVITADALKEKKYKYDGYDGKFFLYDMKSRGTIKACVNESGIVECFRVSSRSWRVYLFYSEKYDKLFYVNGSMYCEGHPYWMTDTKFIEAHNKIKALYEGAK